MTVDVFVCVCIPSNQLDSIFVFHASFDESESDQNRSSAQTSYAVYRDALLRILLKVVPHELQPFTD